MSSLTMLNECGDTTISWSEDRDAEMEQILQKKMDQGVTFFIIERAGSDPELKRLARPADAMTKRALLIPDEDLAKFVSDGGGDVASASREPVKASRVSRSAKEVAKSKSVGVKQRKGG